jgi:hypothetical protein
MIGFLQVLSDGPLPLLKGTELTILTPDFNIALNVGRVDYNISRKEHLYYVDGEAAMVLPSKKKIPAIFGKHAAFMLEFIKNNDLDLNNEVHVVEYFNREQSSREQ